MENAVPNTTAAPVSRWRQLGPVGVLGLMWTAMPATAGTLLLIYLGEVSGWLQDLGPRGLFVYIGIFIVSGGCGFLPTYAQAFAGGWVFGVTVGVPAALTGFTGAALLGYAIARCVSRDRVEDLINSSAKARAIRQALVGHGPLRTVGVVALLRLPPNSPFALTNLMMASAGVAIVPYVLGTMLGMLPRTAVAVAFAAAAAAQGRDIVEAMRENPTVFIAGLSVMFIVLAIIGYVANQAIARLEAAQQPADTVRAEA